MEIKIKKAMLSARSLKVTYSKTIDTAMGEITDDITINGGGLAHDDLLNAFDRLKIHFAMLCDLKETAAFPSIINPDAFNTPDYMENIYIGGISLCGSQESESISIAGGKFAKNRAINTSSPSCRRDSDYEYKDHLFEAEESLVYEIEQYLFHEKFAIRQLAFDFDGEVDMASSDAKEPAEEVAEPKPSKKRKNSVTIPMSAEMPS